HLTWEHLRVIRRRWRGPMIIKGILNAEDAATAVDAGMDGLIVSNHGGRQLDGSVAPLRVLPEIVETARDRVVMLDSGVRRGTDVLKAIALGARCVFVGRPFAFALAVAQRAGAAHAMTLLQQEIARDMGMLGLRELDELTPAWLAETRRIR
ncbi:MAG: alpha-hydroxy acid oxidase, partial [Burkholderiaceae bacterium]